MNWLRWRGEWAAGPQYPLFVHSGLAVAHWESAGCRVVGWGLWAPKTISKILLNISWNSKINKIKNPYKFSSKNSDNILSNHKYFHPLHSIFKSHEIFRHISSVNKNVKEAGEQQFRLCDNTNITMLNLSTAIIWRRSESATIITT